MSYAEQTRVILFSTGHESPRHVTALKMSYTMFFSTKCIHNTLMWFFGLKLYLIGIKRIEIISSKSLNLPQ